MTDTEQGDSVKFTQDAAGEYRWTLRAAGNHEVIAAFTEGDTHRTEALDNLKRVTDRGCNPWEESEDVAADVPGEPDHA